MNQLLNYSCYSCLYFLSSPFPFKFGPKSLIILVLCLCLIFKNNFFSLSAKLEWSERMTICAEYLQWLNVLVHFSLAIQCDFNRKLVVIDMIYGFALMSKTWSHVSISLVFSIWISHYITLQSMVFVLHLTKLRIWHRCLPERASDENR